MEELSQKFNYHSHTTRCGHADFYITDEMYVVEAINAGFKKIAFTDHMPFENNLSCEVGTRMDIEEKDDYFSSIRFLKEKYKDKIQIENGFEVEYDITQLGHIEKLKEDVSKTVLGQHFIIDNFGDRIYWEEIDENGISRDEALKKYTDCIIEAMKRKIPDIIAHPDLFMKFSKRFSKEEEISSRRICEAAIKYDIPLEINLNRIRIWNGRNVPDLEECIEYPCVDFWKIASEYNPKVIFGADVHVKNQYKNFELNCNIAKKLLGKDILEKLRFVDENLQIK